MDISVYSIKSISDTEIRTKLNSHQSFVLENIDRLNMGEAVSSLENQIESLGMKCRVYTKGRSAGIAAEALIPIAGWATLIGMGVHNLATWNPDYEIAKNLITGTLTVNYKK